MVVRPARGEKGRGDAQLRQQLDALDEREAAGPEASGEHR